jgi:hypothetical protein
MEKKTELVRKRKEAKEEIFALKNKTAPVIVFKFLSKLFPKSLSEKNPIYWLCQIILLNALILLPGLLLSVPLGDFERSRDLWIPTVISTEYIVLGFIVAHISQQILFNSISNRIVEKINDIEGLSKLINWLKASWSIRTISVYILVSWFLYEVLVIVGVSFARDNFIGFSFTLIAIPAGFCFGILFHYVVWIMLLDFQLRDYQYDLNTLSPADSEVVTNISRISNTQIYLLAAYFAILTLITSLGIFGIEITPTVALPGVLTCWTIITLQFMITRSTINSIIEGARWKTLNKLQAQINQVEAAGNLSDKDTSEKILRLADIHGRVVASRTNTFDLKSISAFISQLMLPLLGLLLGNLDKVLELLR